jgi:DNA-binding NtrC family response regulator
MTPQPETTCVVVADNRETTDVLHAYLNNLGLRTRTSRHLDEAALPDPDPPGILLLFPDDFPAVDVQAFLELTRARRARSLVLLVTASPQLERAHGRSGPRTGSPIVLAKPAFGWTIIDTIRAHLPRE